MEELVGEDSVSEGEVGEWWVLCPDRNTLQSVAVKKFDSNPP